MGNLNGKQIFSIVGAILSVLMISTTQLTDLFGTGVAKSIVSVAGLGNLMIQSVMAVLTSQGNTVLDVKNMPGVEGIAVNGYANKTLATLAMDPTQNKIVPTLAAEAKVAATANAA